MSAQRILVVEDDEGIRRMIMFNLERAGFDAIEASDCRSARVAVMDQRPDLVLLDWMLPDQNGPEFARSLRRDELTRDIPIIMLTAKGEERDVVTGLELGADDYVTKPFSPKILNARVRAVVRRADKVQSDKGAVVQTDELILDAGRRKVSVRGKEVDLSFTEFQILLFLSRRPGWVFTRSQIVDAVRGDNYPVTDRSVDVQIVGLRKKLGGCGSYIETVRGVGYRFKEIA